LLNDLRIELCYREVTPGGPKSGTKWTLLAQHHRDATLPKQLDSSSRHAYYSPFQP
jgi:hypothetical protein